MTTKTAEEIGREIVSLHGPQRSAFLWRPQNGEESRRYSEGLNWMMRDAIAAIARVITAERQRAEALEARVKEQRAEIKSLKAQVSKQETWQREYEVATDIITRAAGLLKKDFERAEAAEAALATALADGRSKGLEEAAQLCDEWAERTADAADDQAMGGHNMADGLADDIRALAASPGSPQPNDATTPDAAGMRWWVVHRYGPSELTVSPPFESREEAIEARKGDPTTLGVISSEWLDVTSPGSPQPNTGGDDGWRRDIENAPRDGRLIIVPGGVAYWKLEAADVTGNDQGGRWYTVTGEPFPGLPIEWDVNAWRPLPEAPAGKEK